MLFYEEIWACGLLLLFLSLQYRADYGRIEDGWVGGTQSLEMFLVECTQVGRGAGLIYRMCLLVESWSVRVDLLCGKMECGVRGALHLGGK